METFCVWWSNTLLKVSKRPERNPLKIIQKYIGQHDKEFRAETGIEQGLESAMPVDLNRDCSGFHRLPSTCGAARKSTVIIGTGRGNSYTGGQGHTVLLAL